MKRNAKQNGLTGMVFVWRETWKNDPKPVLFSFLNIPFQVLDRLVDVYLVALIVELVTGSRERQLIWVTLAIAGYRLASELVSRYAQWQLASGNYRNRLHFLQKYAAKYMDVDFAYLESTRGKDAARKARNAMAGADYREKSAVEAVFVQSAALLGNLCGLAVYAGIITVLNPVIILLLAVTAGMDYLLQRTLVRYDHRDKQRYVPLDRRLWYLIGQLRELTAAKDIRLYGMLDWIRSIFRKNLQARMRLHDRRNRLQYAFLVLINLINTAFTGYIYYYLIGNVLAGDIAISGFLVYFGLITGFNTWLMSVVGNVEQLHQISLNIGDLHTFLTVSDASRGGQAGASAEQAAIRFENVSFSYGGDREVIRNLSFSVAPGEKLALVGRNGAGKTTLIKLLCGLYVPDSGRILVDGQDVQSLSREALFGKIAAVFQDIHLLPTTVVRNITLSPAADAGKLEQALAQSGLGEKLAALPQKEQTVLVRGVGEEAVELSGGEIQKLALARALYKGGEIFLLDEPTAALDPLAEYEMYLRYSELTKGKTAVFISHRLSSTRFCDRILYMEDGQITESGTHEELMTRQGAYARMFETQSRYYKTQEVTAHEGTV